MCCCCVDGHLTLVFCLITMCCCCIDVHLTLADSMYVLLTIWLSRLVVVLRCLSDLHRAHQRSCCFPHFINAFAAYLCHIFEPDGDGTLMF